MKVLRTLLATIVAILGVAAARTFLKNYKIGLYYINKNDIDEEESLDLIDLRGTPTHECVCGSNVFYVRAVFKEYEISSYFLDMICAECGSLATAPTLVDKENTE